MSRFGHFVRRIDATVAAFEITVAAAAFVVVLLLPVVQITLRVVAQSGLSWADEVTRHAVLWFAMAGAARAAGRNAHLAVDLFDRGSVRVQSGAAADGPRRRRRLLLAVAAIVGGATGVTIGVIAITFVRVEAEFGDTVGGLFPTWWSAATLPAGLLLVGLRLIGSGIAGLLAVATGSSPGDTEHNRGTDRTPPPNDRSGDQ